MPRIAKEDVSAIAKMASARPDVDVSPDRVKKLLDAKFVVSDESLGEICAALNSGSHVILSGPPGTGKTTLATAAATAAQGVSPMMSTATADWTTFDTVGGYMPDLATNALTFETGVILQSMIDRRWIIVDEINRAPIDKAIGQLFTVLSGGSVLLPFRDTATGGRIRIEMSNALSGPGCFTCPEDWRMIATMNEYDKDSLFDMSYAFMRRFAIIRIGLPPNYAGEIKTWATAASIAGAVADHMTTIIDTQMENREIGPAIFKSIISYIVSRKKIGGDDFQSYAEALSIFLIPQYQGCDDSTVRSIYECADNFFAANGMGSHSKIFKDSIAAMTGYSPS